MTTQSELPWVELMSVGALLLLFGFLGLRVLLGRSMVWTKCAWVVSLLMGFWFVAAWCALLEELAAYHFGVLAHECPWCLFAARHRGVGYALFGLLGVLVAEASALLVASVVAQREGSVVEAARHRVKKLTWRASIAVFLYCALSLGPAIWWRLSGGVWIDGGP